MKVLIFPSDRVDTPEELDTFLDRGVFPHNRIGEIVEYVESQAYHRNSFLHDVKISRGQKYWDSDFRCCVTPYTFDIDSTNPKLVFICYIESPTKIVIVNNGESSYETLVPEEKTQPSNVSAYYVDAPLTY